MASVDRRIFIDPIDLQEARLGEASCNLHKAFVPVRPLVVLAERGAPQEPEPGASVISAVPSETGLPKQNGETSASLNLDDSPRAAMMRAEMGSGGRGIWLSPEIPEPAFGPHVFIPVHSPLSDLDTDGQLGLLGQMEGAAH